MSIAAFAKLRTLLRRTESAVSDEQVTLQNIHEWQGQLRAAVKACYDNPLDNLGPLDVDSILKVATRVTEPAVLPHEFARDQAIRSAIIAELVGPAATQAGAGDARDNKKAIAKAMNGLRTVVEAACSGFVRYYCDRTDTESGEAGIRYKLLAVRDGMLSDDLPLTIARIESLLDPTFTLHLGLAEFEDVQRIVSPDGHTRFMQKSPHDRPFALQQFTVTFDSLPLGAAPPSIGAVFVNDAHVDAFWDWKGDGDDGQKRLSQTLKLSKAQPAVRSWSVVLGTTQALTVAAETDFTSTTLIERPSYGTVRVVAKPGRLVATPLLRDIITAILRHFHGSVSQENVVVTVVQSRMTVQAQVYAAALQNAALPTSFHQASAEVTIVVPGTPPVRRRVSWLIHVRLFVVLILAATALRRVLRGWRWIAAGTAITAILVQALRRMPFARRALMGPCHIPKRRLLALAVAVARATGSSAAAPNVRTQLAALLASNAVPLAEVSQGELEAAMLLIGRYACEHSAPTSAYPKLCFVENAAAIAATLEGAVTSAPAPSAAVISAVDLVRRQASMLPTDMELLQIGAVSDGLPIAIPRVSRSDDEIRRPIDITVFSVDRSAAVVAPIPVEQAKFLAAYLTNIF